MYGYAERCEENGEWGGTETGSEIALGALVMLTEVQMRAHD
jgi:hypothetical protein